MTQRAPSLAQYAEERAYTLGSAAQGRRHPEWGDHLRENDRLRLCFWYGWADCRAERRAAGVRAGWQGEKMRECEERGLPW